MVHIVSFAFLALLAAGCGNPPPGNNTEKDAGADGSAPVGPGIMGILKDHADQPIGGGKVLACMATLCLFGDAEPDGRFFFPIEPTAEVALKTLPDPTATPRKSAALCPVRIVDSSLIDVGSLHVPSLPEGALIGPAAQDPQTLTAGDGIVLTLRVADLTPYLGDTLIDIAARRIPPSQACPWVVPEGEELVAVYALHPFAAVSSSPIAIRAPSDLPAGTKVQFRTISEIDGAFSEPVPGEADGTSVATAPQMGITELTWLVISRD
ncbi:hypothetical protein [Polyangium jinanense]|uniref:Uncharacterized protein n=1 Tax=Polyangium jinanense TaxID=2829994 RepID=A0A9X3X7Q9_9BACT|nr:hypothetical protein [Polyangium jinanense]MDC3960422.1 hypothetical protein [Polyangium jinanense]MDC3985334.1 hypothetical protein [Polyangium jinanense]